MPSLVELSCRNNYAQCMLVFRIDASSLQSLINESLFKVIDADPRLKTLAWTLGKGNGLMDEPNDREPHFPR